MGSQKLPSSLIKSLRFETKEKTVQDNFDDLLEHELYKQYGMFRKWFKSPEKYFSMGGYVLRCYSGTELIATTILNNDCPWYMFLDSLSHIRHTSQPMKIVGLIDFFVKPDYRRQGIATLMASHMEKTIKSNWNKESIPVVIATGYARHVVKKTFKHVAAVDPGDGLLVGETEFVCAV